MSYCTESCVDVAFVVECTAALVDAITAAASADAALSCIDLAFLIYHSLFLIHSHPFPALLLPSI